MDSAIIPKGVKRCPLPVFLLGIAAVSVVLLWGVYAMLLCWLKGLNQTNMNDSYGFALWIWADLAVIALGGGAFFTGLLRYVFGVKELKNIINFAVVLGFICYSSAQIILGLDVGQPLRAWFIFWHPNVHSMLTEVAFCLSCYFAVLTIEYLPLSLENRKLQEIPFIQNLTHNMHHVMVVFAATGAFLSFFHQGSLGGVTGVLYGRPFAFREHLLVWPWTFFLFTWSAAACGPCFTILVTRMTEIVTRKKLVKDNVIHLLAKIAGWMLLTYIVAKSADTLYWAFYTAREMGFDYKDFYSGRGIIWWAHGEWMLWFEILVCGWLPALILVSGKLRNNKALFWTAIILACIGVCLNRWVLIMQTMAMPVLPFTNWNLYLPSWQEVATTILPVAYGIIFIAVSHRYLPIFPQEAELNPLEEEPTMDETEAPAVAGGLREAEAPA